MHLVATTPKAVGAALSAVMAVAAATLLVAVCNEGRKHPHTDQGLAAAVVGSMGVTRRTESVDAWAKLMVVAVEEVVEEGAVSVAAAAVSAAAAAVSAAAAAAVSAGVHWLHRHMMGGR